MSEWAAATITLLGVGGKEGRIASILSEYDFGLAWLKDDVEPHEVNSAATFYSAASSWGIITEMTAKLEPLGVVYSAWIDINENDDGLIRMYTPELGEYETYGSRCGDTLVHAGVIDTYVDQLLAAQVPTDNPTDLLEFLKANLAVLDLKSGGPWRRAIASLLPIAAH